MRPRRRCSCDRQRVPRRRARVGGLCGFPGAAERVPARSRKTERRADVRGVLRKQQTQKEEPCSLCRDLGCPGLRGNIHSVGEHPTEQDIRKKVRFRARLFCCMDFSAVFTGRSAGRAHTGPAQKRKRKIYI